MYLSYFNLNRKPFSISPDPDFLWLGPKHQEGLAVLKYGILDDKGFLALTGDVGTGKTALIKGLVKTVGVAAIVVTVPDPGMEKLDFYNYLADEFNMSQTFKSKGEFLIAFKQFLLKAYSSDRKVLLIIDEAQRLSHELLEEIRVLSNIEKNNMKLIGNKTKRLICPNMKTIIMVKADKSRATKTGHFYLSLTLILQFFISKYKENKQIFLNLFSSFL
jgi:general secretion pathway protein A